MNDLMRPALYNAQHQIIPLRKTNKRFRGNIEFVGPICENSDKFLSIATTRPETYFGDTALMVHPDDDRYKEFVGKNVILPILNKKLKLLQMIM